MKVSRRNFPEIMLDNDETFFAQLIGVVDSVDELASIEIVKTEHSFHVRIAPSIAKYIEPILYEVLKFNNMFGIHLDLSKSMKASSTVTFDIEV
jgi:hypothetical protein